MHMHLHTHLLARTHPRVCTRVHTAIHIPMSATPVPTAIYIYDVVNAKLTAKLEGHRGCVTAVDHHPTDSALVSVATDGTLRIWTARSSEAS